MALLPERLLAETALLQAESQGGFSHGTGTEPKEPVFTMLR